MTTTKLPARTTTNFGDFAASVAKVTIPSLKTSYGEREAEKIKTLGKIYNDIGLTDNKQWFDNDKFNPSAIDEDKAKKRTAQIRAAQDYRRFKTACEKLGGDLKRRARGEEPRAADFVFEADFIAPLRDSRKKASSASPVCGGDSKKYSTAVTRVGCSGGDRAVSVASLVSPRVSSSY